jgi:hypothetical protein
MNLSCDVSTCTDIESERCRDEASVGLRESLEL